MFPFFFLHCPLSRPVLIYISLLFISCIIEYVTNKRTLNVESVFKASAADFEQLQYLTSAAGLILLSWYFDGSCSADQRRTNVLTRMH